VKLAHQSLALGGADVNECDVNTLARAVIEQDAEIQRLKAALREAYDVAEQANSYEPKSPTTAGRIAELRRLT
jgi:hypothetical protein